MSCARAVLAAPFETAELLAEIDVLRERVRQLETELGARMVFAPGLRLTRAEAVVLGILLARALASAATLVAGATVLGRDRVPSIESIHVLAHRLRRKLAPHGVAIHSLAGQGFYIDEAGKAALAGFLTPGKDSVVARETAGGRAP